MAKILIRVDSNSDFELACKKTITVDDKELFDYIRNYVYLNGEFPEWKTVCKHYRVIDLHTYRHRLANLNAAGLLCNDSKTKKWSLAPGSPGMCRIPFRGELRDKEIHPTGEKIVNFYDLFNTNGIVCYRVMTKLKHKYVRYGDYILISEYKDYQADDVVVLSVGGDVIVGKYIERIHDKIVVDFDDGDSHRLVEGGDYVSLGVVVGVVRMEMQLDKIFTRSRLKILGQQTKTTEVIFDTIVTEDDFE